MWERLPKGSEAPRRYSSTGSGERFESKMVRPTMACRISGLVRSAQQPESRYPAGCQYPVRPRFTGSYFRRRIRRRRRYIWIHPDPDFNDEIVFNPEHPNWILHKELLKACKAKANGHYYVGMPDLMEAWMCWPH